MTPSGSDAPTPVDARPSQCCWRIRERIAKIIETNLSMDSKGCSRCGTCDDSDCSANCSCVAPSQRSPRR
ncbi:hypothetical protein ACFPRL_24345 [Pseudoclavibacter helvolus]